MIPSDIVRLGDDVEPGGNATESAVGTMLASGSHGWGTNRIRRVVKFTVASTPKPTGANPEAPRPARQHRGGSKMSNEPHICLPAAARSFHRPADFHKNNENQQSLVDPAVAPAPATPADAKFQVLLKI